MSVYVEIQAERERQDAKWGGPDHDDRHFAEDWASYIDERVQEIGTDGPGSGGHPEKTNRQRFLEIAALAVAAIESFDRPDRRIRYGR